MWLQLQFTYARNSSFAAIGTGALDNIRLMSGDSQTQGLNGGKPPLHPWRRIQDAASLPASNPDSLDTFSAVWSPPRLEQCTTPVAPFSTIQHTGTYCPSQRLLFARIISGILR